MAAERYKYHFDGIATARADIMAAAARLNQTHTDVTELMNRLSKTWKAGPAATAWQGYQTEWNAIFSDVAAELASLGTAVDQALHNAHSAETANGSMWPD